MFVLRLPITPGNHELGAKVRWGMRDDAGSRIDQWLSGRYDDVADYRDLYRTMADNAGVADDPEYAPARAGELARSALDAAKAGRVLGWAPQTDLRAGTANVLEWFRAQSA
jgi:nucleoside-diphosphate-sugar epimerase